MSSAVMYPRDVEIVRNVLKQAILNAGFEMQLPEVVYLKLLEKQLGELSNDNTQGIIIQDSKTYAEKLVI